MDTQYTERFQDIGVPTVNDQTQYNTECPECGALFHMDKRAEAKLVTGKEILDNLLINELVRCRVSIVHRNIKKYTYYCVSNSEPFGSEPTEVQVSVPKKLFRDRYRWKYGYHGIYPGIQDVEVTGIVKIGLMKVPTEVPELFQRTERYIIIKAKSIKTIGNWTGKDYIISKRWLKEHECPQCSVLVEVI